jgi:uncharacterized protein (DUF924 family)
MTIAAAELERPAYACAMDTPTDASEVVAFWREAGEKRWFSKDAAFDAEFRRRFLARHEAASTGALAGWLDDAESALALVLLLDQFPRNCFRGTVRVYATDAQALKATGAAIDAGFDLRTEPALRVFFYLPYSHSEALADQDRAVELAARLPGNAQAHALGHREIVRRFGRFPHRNALLGRMSTQEELTYLAAGGFAG